MPPTPVRALRRLLGIGLLLAAGLSPLPADVQTLTDQQGRSITAEIISVDKDHVKIKRTADGQEFDLPLSTLSEADQKKVKDWAAAEAAKPLPANALDVLMSRAKFSASKVSTPQLNTITYSDGTIRTITKTLITTTEQWGYSITLTDRLLKPITGLRAEYILFSGAGVRGSKSPLTISVLAPHQPLVVKTATLPLVKTNIQGEGRPMGDSLSGIWLRVYRGDELVYEASSPENLCQSNTW